MTGIRQYLHHSLFLCNQVDTDICIHLSDQHRSLYLKWGKIKIEEMKISKNFHQGAITIAICFGDFAFVALKLKKVGPMFSRFNPYSLLPSVATDDSLMLKETVSMLKCSLRKQNWIVIFGIQLMGK